MKYIRTKGGIFRRYKNSTIKDNVFYYPDNGGFPEYRRKPILKQADSIEELCDEFVVYVKDNIKAVRIFPKGKAMEYSIYLKQTDNLDSDIYGAIWTDKGLIYVAKMNEKGDLELL